MKLYKTKRGIIIYHEEAFYLSEESWDEFINRDNLFIHTLQQIEQLPQLTQGEEVIKNELLPPIGNHEIWASGVTYYKSREARMDEAKDAGGGDFYDRVYYAERPELFLKATQNRAVGSGQKVRIRSDSNWNVPEPELTLLISANKEIIGYTIGNDMSSRDIEGENPLYLPQAKCYDGAAAIGPCILVKENPIPSNTKIQLEIIRNRECIFSGTTQVDQIKRKFEQLVEYLFLEMSFEQGVFLMTGTGIVPPNELTLTSKDEIKITIDHIGTLINYVA